MRCRLGRTYEGRFDCPFGSIIQKKFKEINQPQLFLSSGPNESQNCMGFFCSDAMDTILNSNQFKVRSVFDAKQRMAIFKEAGVLPPQSSFDKQVKITGLVFR